MTCIGLTLSPGALLLDWGIWYYLEYLLVFVIRFKKWLELRIIIGCVLLGTVLGCSFV